VQTHLGKIKKAAFGWGGYNESMIGLTVTLGGESWGVGDFWGAWGVQHTEFCKWTEDERRQQLGDTCMRLSELLNKAKVDSVEKLVGTSIEATFDGNLLKSWRVLGEVL